MSRQPNAVRESLLHESTEKVEMRWIWARSQGVDRPVVLLLDARDAHGRAILETSGESERIGAYVATGVRRGLVPTMSWGLPPDLAQELISREFGGHRRERQHGCRGTGTSWRPAASR